MSTYCSKCSPFDGQFDINLLKMALRLNPGESENFLCDGCSNCGLYKDDLGNLYIAVRDDTEIKMRPVAVEELMP